MRLIHTSDWHLGQELHAFDRSSEHDAFFEWLLEQSRRLAADALIVTGDIYESANPPVAAQQRLYQFVGRVLATNDQLQIVLIGGNHDSPGRLELPRSLVGEDRVHLIGALPRTEGRTDLSRALIQLRNRAGTPSLTCIAIPFLRSSDLPPGAGSAGVSALYADGVALARAAQLPIIATGHLHIRGGEVSEVSERSIYIGGEAAISSDIFDESIRYVALGHLHKPQAVPGATTIRYAGSPFPMSVTERTYEHSIGVVDIDTSGSTSVDLLRIPRHVEFLRVPEEGAAALDAVERQLRELVVEKRSPERHPFLEVAVQLYRPEPDLRRRIDDALASKTVRLTRVQPHRAPGADVMADAALGTDDVIGQPAEVFRLLHQREFRTDPEPAVSALFDEVLAAARTPDAERDLS
jgi:exonuclease SbcD